MPASVSVLISRPAFTKEESTVMSPVITTANLKIFSGGKKTINFTFNRTRLTAIISQDPNS